MRKILSKKQIADKIKRSLPTIYRWMDGTCPISADDAIKMEAITGVKAAAWLLPYQYKNPYFKYKKKSVDEKN